MGVWDRTLDRTWDRTWDKTWDRTDIALIHKHGTINNTATKVHNGFS